VAFDELAERWASAVGDARAAMRRAAARRAERVRELAERLRDYHVMLEQLCAHEAQLVAAWA
jgi:hypothetical protein